MKTNKKVLYGGIAYCAIIGIIYIILSTLALLTRDCIIDTKNSPFTYMLYLMYFRGHECGQEIDWNVFTTTNDLIDNDLIESSQTPAASQRTYIFTISYLTLNVALVLATLLALIGTLKSYISRKTFIIFLTPLIVVLVAIIICDLVAASMYFIDITSVSNGLELKSFLELKGADITTTTTTTIQDEAESSVMKLQNDATIDENVSKVLSQISFFTRIGPPVVMGISTSKLLVFWIFNIFWCIAIIKHGWLLAKEKEEEEMSNYQNAIVANDNPAFEDENSHKANMHSNPLSRQYDFYPTSMTQTERQTSNQYNYPDHQAVQAIDVVERTEQRYLDTSRTNDYVYPPQTYSISSKQKQPMVEATDEITFKIHRPTLKVSTQKSSTPPPGYSDNEIDNRMNRYIQSKGRPPKPAYTYENVQRDRENSYQSINDQIKPRPILPHRPSSNNNKFYLQSTGHEEPTRYRNDFRSSSPKVEKPNNVFIPPHGPFSYLHSRDDAPRKTLMHIDAPDMPMPDYNSPTRKRRINTAPDTNENWNNQRY